jgi:hypothetical protein
MPANPEDLSSSSSLLSPGEGLVKELVADLLEAVEKGPEYVDPVMLRSAAQALQAATERAEQAEKDRACYLKNLEDAQGDIAAEVAANQQLREQFRAADQLRVEALALVEKWRAQGAIYDSHHATMGIGYKACADDLASLLTRPIAPPSSS